MPNIADSPAVSLPLQPTDRLYGERAGQAVQEFQLGDITALAQQGMAPATHTHTPAAIGAATTAQGAKADAALQPGALPAGTTLEAEQISDAGAAGRELLRKETLPEIQALVSMDGAIAAILTKLQRAGLRDTRRVMLTPPTVTTSVAAFAGFANAFPRATTNNANWTGVANFWGGFMARAGNRIKPRSTTATPASATDPLLTTGFDDGGSGMSFYCDADVASLFVNTSNTNAFRFFIDELDGNGPLAVSLVGTTAAGTGDSYIKLDFTLTGGAKERLIHVEGPQAWAFSRIFLATGSTYQVWSGSRDAMARIAILHDSYGFGPLPGHYTTPTPITQDGYVMDITRQLGYQADIYNSSVGGSGLNVVGGGGKPAFEDRVYDALNLLPDGATPRSAWYPEVIVVGGSINNNSTPNEQLTAALDEIYTFVRARTTSVPIVVTGPVQRPADFGIGAALDNNELYRAWVASKVATGDKRIGFASVTSATDKWIDGGGYIGAETGAGISDAMIGNDGAHPSYKGHPYYARRLIAGVAAALAQMS